MTRSASLAVLELGPAMAGCLDEGMVGVVGVGGVRKSEAKEMRRRAAKGIKVWPKRGQMVACRA
jgi:hypothetical protein